jgi:pyruvate kinase
VTDPSHLGTNEAITCSYKSLPTTIGAGSTIYIADGNLTCKVISTSDDKVTVKVMNDFVLGERKNMNLPGAIIDLPTLTE